VGVEETSLSVGGGESEGVYFSVHNIVLQDTITDRWRWMLDLIHGYYVR